MGTPKQDKGGSGSWKAPAASSPAQGKCGNGKQSGVGSLKNSKRGGPSR